MAPNDLIAGGYRMAKALLHRMVDDLTPAEFYKLILAADMGVNYYARENNPHSSDY